MTDRFPVLLGMENTQPIMMLLWCPECGERHIDEMEFALKPHHTHACQSCGMTWRPAIVPTVGVRFLPGFKNEEGSEEEETHGLEIDLSLLGNGKSDAEMIAKLEKLSANPVAGFVLKSRQGVYVAGEFFATMRGAHEKANALGMGYQPVPVAEVRDNAQEDR